MKKNLRLLFLFLGLIWSALALGQIIANEANASFASNNTSNIYLPGYVTINGNQIIESQVNISFVSATNSGLSVSGANVLVASGLNAGMYTLTYQVCETANPTSCATGVVNVIICSPITPIVSVIQPSCNNFGGTAIFSGLPLGNWTMTFNGGAPINSSGSTYTRTNLTPGNYVVSITDNMGCGTAYVTVFIEANLLQTLTVVPQTCVDPSDSIVLTDLPTSGTWSLKYRTYNSAVTTITGTGNTYTLTGLAPDYYYFRVMNNSGCYSTEVTASVGYLDNIAGTMSAAYVDYNNDGITNLGDIIAYTLTITNNLSCPMETVNYSIHAVPYAVGTVSNLAAGATTVVTLNCALTQSDINNGSVSNWIALLGTANGFSSYAKVFDQNPAVTLNISDGIKLSAFFDTNNNGVQNVGEQSINQGYFTYQLNNSGVVHDSYSPDGMALIYESNPSNSYDLTYNLYNNCTAQFDASTVVFNDITVPAGTGITIYNFPIVQSPCQDVQIYLYGGLPRPGCNYVGTIYYRNIGNQTMTAGTITFTKDSLLSITANSEASAATTATGFTYNFSNLLPDESRTIQVTMMVPPIPSVALGQILNNSVSITIPVSDVNPGNNTSVLCQTISGSYDPNNKTESHAGKIVYDDFTVNDYLTYTVRFENTGTAAAISIRVNDILDAKLDENSIKMVTASHPYVLDRVGTNLTWRFDGINLPPSVVGDELTGHGYIVFQIKPKPGFALGDIIPNSADIFFDFNPAIVTNTCTTEFVPFLGVNAFDADAFDYFPNPTSGIVTFAFKNTATTINSIEVADILGKTLISKTVHYSNATIDLSALEKGIYLITIKGNGQQKTIKIVQQ